MAQKLPNVFSIGWLVERYGVSPESIRNWERQGLIPQTTRTPGGHRRYNRSHVEALDALFGFKPRPQVQADVSVEAQPQLHQPSQANVRRDEPGMTRRPSHDLRPLSRV